MRGDRRPRGLEVGLGVAQAVDPGALPDRVADRVDPLLVAAVRVVGDQQLVAGDAAAVLDQLLGLGRVELAEVPAGALLVALDALGHPGGGRLAGALQHRLGDGVAVDRHRQALAHLGLVRRGPVGLVEREADVLDGALRGVHRPVAEVVLVRRQRGRRHLVHHVQVVGLQVGVGGLGRGVHLEDDAAVLRLVHALVVREGLGDDLAVVRPTDELVRAVAHRLLPVPGRVLEEAVRQRREGDVAELVLEVRDLVAQLDREVQVVGDGQAGHLVRGRLAGGRVDVLVALDVREPRAVDLVVGGAGAPVPGVDEVLGVHRGAVVELPAVLQRDGEGLRVAGLDLVRDLHPDLGVGGVVVDQPLEEVLDDATAADLVRVGGLQRVLRLVALVAEGLAGVRRAAAPSPAATAPGGHQDHGRRSGEDQARTGGYGHGGPSSRCVSHHTP